MINNFILEIKKHIYKWADLFWACPDFALIYIVLSCERVIFLL